MFLTSCQASFHHSIFNFYISSYLSHQIGLDRRKPKIRCFSLSPPTQKFQKANVYRKGNILAINKRRCSGGQGARHLVCFTGFVSDT